MSVALGHAAVQVRLDPDALLWAAHVGVRRRVSSLGARARYGAPTTGRMLWGQDIEAAAAELALATYLGVPWTGAEPCARWDVGERYQVRWTDLLSGRLIVHETEDDGDVFVLVTGSMGDYWLHGWISGAFAKLERDLWTPPVGRTAYFVPRARLGPMQELLGA